MTPLHWLEIISGLLHGGRGLVLGLTSTPPVRVTTVVRLNFPGCCYWWGGRGWGGGRGQRGGWWWSDEVMIMSVRRQTEKVSALTKTVCPHDSDSKWWWSGNVAEGWWCRDNQSNLVSCSHTIQARPHSPVSARHRSTRIFSPSQLRHSEKGIISKIWTINKDLCPPSCRARTGLAISSPPNKMRFSPIIMREEEGN